MTCNAHKSTLLGAQGAVRTKSIRTVCERMSCLVFFLSGCSGKASRQVSQFLRQNPQAFIAVSMVCLCLVFFSCMSCFHRLFLFFSYFVPPLFSLQFNPSFENSWYKYFVAYLQSAEYFLSIIVELVKFIRRCQHLE